MGEGRRLILVTVPEFIEFVEEESSVVSKKTELKSEPGEDNEEKKSVEDGGDIVQEESTGNITPPPPGDQPPNKTRVNMREQVAGVLNYISRPDVGLLDEETSVIYNPCDNGKYQIQFLCSENSVAEIVQRLRRVGVTMDSGSGTISVLPVEHSWRHAPEVPKTPPPEKDAISNADAPAVVPEQKFLTLASVLRGETLAQQIDAGAKFDFDFLCFVLTAAILAAAGLGSESQVVLVASMLVSPMMGPVLAFTYGSFIRDRRLVIRGLISETLVIVLCVVCGGVAGLLCSLTDWGDNFPTNEMASRGTTNALLLGLPIAIPSGVAVGLSVLSGNANSLVGVAISASLLPPAVNAGMCWVMAIFESDRHLLTIGAYSMLLTIENIGCIFFASYAMFWLKINRGDHSAWRQDMDVTRRYQKAMRRTAMGYDKDAMGTIKGGGAGQAEAAERARRLCVEMKKQTNVAGQLNTIMAQHFSTASLGKEVGATPASQSLGSRGLLSLFMSEEEQALAKLQKHFKNSKIRQDMALNGLAAMFEEKEEEEEDLEAGRAVVLPDLEPADPAAAAAGGGGHPHSNSVWHFWR